MSITARCSYDVFDVPRFIDDIETTRRRWRITRGQLRAELDNCGAGYAILRGDRPPGLVAAVLLANACDLSLDSYRLAGVR